MLKKYLKRITAVALSLAVTVTSAAVCQPETAKAAYVNPRRVSVHDPSIFKDTDGTYYVFGSHMADAKSTDLINWTQINPDWNSRNRNWQTDSIYKGSAGNVLTNLAEPFEWAGYNDADCSNGGVAVWAPDIIYNENYEWSNGEKGAYMMYFCTTSSWKRSCIAYAVSKKADGPYDYVDTVIYSGFTRDGRVDNGTNGGSSTRNTKWNNDYLNLNELIAKGTISGISDNWFNGNDWNANYAPNAIDPCIFYDKDGNLYMVYGSWSGGLFLLELDEKTGAVKYPGKDSTDSATGTVTDRYFGTRIAGGNHKSGEAPYILYDKETGYYYLYETYGGLTANGGYNMRMFRSKNVDGPYVDAAGKKATANNGNNYSQYGIKLIGNYSFSGQQGYRAAGHNSAMIDTDGKRYLFYHQRFENRGEYHEVRVRQQFLNEDGWPVETVYEYRDTDAKIENYSNNDVTGTYEIINHGTATDGSMIYSQTAVLKPDGKVAGDVTGTWTKTDSKKGYDYVTLKVGGVTYKGFFMKQYSEKSTSAKVMTFSAIGSDNTCLWGSMTNSSTEASTNSLIYGFDFETAPSGKNLTPVSGSAKNGLAVLKGTAKIESDSQRGSVLHLTNSAGAKGINYLALPSDTLTTVTSSGYTVSMWVNVCSSSTNPNSALFEADGGGKDQYPVTRISVNSISRINAQNDGATYADTTKAYSYKTNEWHHYMYTVGPDGIHTYLDGKLFDTDTSKNIGLSFESGNQWRIQTATNVCVGSGYIWDDEDVRDVKFDDVYIYKGTMGANQASELFTEQQKDLSQTTDNDNNDNETTTGDNKNETTTDNNKNETTTTDNNKNETATTDNNKNETAATDNPQQDGGESGTTASKSVKKVTIKSVKSTKKKQAIIKWKKVSGAKGYQIQYSLKKSFKKKKAVTIKKVKTIKKTIKKLKSGKKYYFRMRAYKTSNGKKVYGKWSNVKKVKVK